MLPLQRANDPEHTFLPGITFDQIHDLYVFDRELRLIVFDIIERIEVGLRTQIIYQFSMAHGAWWFENTNLFRDHNAFERCLQDIDREVDRSHEVFIRHYKREYTSPARPPAWMSMEVTSMGTLSKTYQNLKRGPAKKAVATHFGLQNPGILESWMQSLTYVRNLCAHHSRFWNRILTIRPTLPVSPSVTTRPWLAQTAVANDRAYAFLSCMIYLLKVVAPTTQVPQRIKDLLAKFPSTDARKMGFPPQWEQEVLWN